MLGKLIPWKSRHEGDRNIRERTHGNPALQLREELDALWDHFWDQSQRGGRVDFDDTEKELIVRAELPGFEPDELDVKVSGNVLTLRAEHKEEGKEKNGSYRRYNSFLESFTLPRGVLTDKTEANYRNGVLEVHLPKGEGFQAKRIAVKPS